MPLSYTRTINDLALFVIGALLGDCSPSNALGVSSGLGFFAQDATATSLVIALVGSMYVEERMFAPIGGCLLAVAQNAKHLALS